MSKSRTIKLFIISVLVQLCMFVYDEHAEHMHHPTQFENTRLAIMRGDAHSYVDPIENWKATGEYGVSSFEAGFSRYGRTPYYGMIYAAARFFLEPNDARDAVIIVQLLLKILANVVFFRMVLLLTKNERIAWIAFLVFTFCALASLHIDRIMTESTACSFFIFGLYYYFLWRETGSMLHLMTGGFFCALTICERAFLLPVFALFILAHVISDCRISWKKSLVNLVFFVPLMVILSPWVIRNYSISGRLIVFQENVNAGYYYAPAELSLRDYLTATGESFMPWDYEGAGSWFDPGFKDHSTFVPPSTMYSQSVTPEIVTLAREQYMNSITLQDSLSGEMADSMFRYMRKRYMQERPFQYYVSSPLRVLKHAFVHNGMELLYSAKWYGYVYKVLQSGLFVLISLGFVLFWLVPSIRGKDKLWTIPVGLALVLCFGFRFSERRYFLYAYPVFMLYSSMLVNYLLRNVKVADK